MVSAAEEGWRSERRERLLRAAARVFARSGFEQASMDEIAREAGFGKPTLYRYYPGKETLYAAVFADELDRLETRLETVLEGDEAVRLQLGRLVAAIVPTFRDHLVSPRMLGPGSAAIDHSQRRIFRERRTRIAGFLQRAVENGIERGEIRWSVEPARVANMMIGMIWAGTAAGRVSEGTVTADVVGLLLDGIGERDARRPADWEYDGRARPTEDTRAPGVVRADEASLP